MTQIFKLVYRSRARWHADQAQNEADIANIVSTAQAYNAVAGITGALLVSATGYAQVLEGDSDLVKALYQRIVFDPRHEDVELLYGDYHPDRDFENWAMAVVTTASAFEIELTSTARRFPVAVPDNADDIRGMLRALLLGEGATELPVLH